MKQIRRAGLWLVAALMLSGVATASASAALPEIGRCLPVEGIKEGKKTVHNGAYKNAGCTKESPTKTGKYEWMPGAGEGEAKKFEGAGGSEAATFATPAGTRMTCTDAYGEGEVTGEKTESLTYIFSGCEDTVLHESCQSVLPEEKEVKPIEGEIKSLPMTGEVGFISNGEKPKVGFDFKPLAGKIIAEYECGGPIVGATQVLLEGSVIAAYKPANKMREESFLTFKAKSGKQLPEAFEGGEPDTLTATFTSGLSSTTEPITVTHVEELFREEALEVKAKP